MALCNDIMWMVGQYVETYRNNKKIKKKFTIFGKSSIIEHDAKVRYGNKTYREICDMHKNSYYMIKFRSGKNNSITKQDRIDEIVYKRLYESANYRIKKLQEDSIFYERPNYENLMSGDKIYCLGGPSTQYTRTCNLSYQNSKIGYLQDSMTQQEKDILEKLETMLGDVVNVDDCEYLISQLIRNKIKIIERIGTKYNIRAWENAWTRIVRNEPQGLTATFNFDEELLLPCVIRAQ